MIPTASAMQNDTPHRRCDEWYTPPWVIRELGGRFDTDPGAPRRRHWTAKNCYTIKEDGLKQPWTGLVFCNPPYSNAMPWVERMMDHQPGGAFSRPGAPVVLVSGSGAGDGDRLRPARYAPLLRRP
jgi:hypothetical protein